MDFGYSGGSGGTGSIGGGGTLNTIAMFSPDGSSVGDSILTQTGSTVVTIGSEFTFNTSTDVFQIGAGTMTAGLNLNIFKSSNGTTGLSSENHSTGASAVNRISWVQTSTKYLYLSKYGSGYSGNLPNTSIGYANSAVLASSSAAPGDGTAPVILAGSRVYSVIGQTAANLGYVSDSVGLRVDRIDALDTTNLNAFTVNGKSYFGTNATATTTIHVGGSLGLLNNVSNAGTITIGSAARTVYVFYGTTATYTLPSVAGNTDTVYFIKNRGSGALTIGANAGASEIYDTAVLTSFIINPGEAYILINDGTYWCTY